LPPLLEPLVPLLEPLPPLLDPLPPHSLAQLVDMQTPRLLAALAQSVDAEQLPRLEFGGQAHDSVLEGQALLAEPTWLPQLLLRHEAQELPAMPTAGQLVAE
jgi:hypothetical protein